MAGKTFFSPGTAWRQITDPEWKKASWGRDEATIQFSGRKDQCAAFQTQNLSPFSVMPEYNSMWLDSYTVRDHRSFPVIDAVYCGFRSGTVPAVKGEDSFTIQSVTVTGTTVGGPNPGTKIQGTVTYRASRTTYTWFTNQAPGKSPQYATVRNPVNPILNIISWNVTDATGKGNLVSYQDFITVLNSLIVEQNVSEYTTEDLILSRLWGCRSSVELVMIGV